MFQLDNGWLKEVHPTNIPYILVTDEVSQLDNGWLNKVHPANIPFMFVTDEVFQSAIESLNSRKIVKQIRHIGYARCVPRSNGSMTTIVFHTTIVSHCLFQFFLATRLKSFGHCCCCFIIYIFFLSKFVNCLLYAIVVIHYFTTILWIRTSSKHREGSMPVTQGLVKRGAFQKHTTHVGDRRCVP